MTPKRIVASSVGIWILLVVVLMAWQVGPVSAGLTGFTPTTVPTAAATVTETPAPQNTPSMPLTGGSTNADSGFGLVLLAGAILILLVAVSLGLKKWTGTRKDQ